MDDLNADPRVGRIFNAPTKVEVLRVLGAGGMGVVYEVLHLATQRRRALKVLKKADDAGGRLLGRFRAEAKVAAKLDTPYVVETFESDVLDDGSPYILMELLTGSSVASLIDTSGRLAPPHAAYIVWQACQGVAVAHDQGIIHRDLKPENLFLETTREGNEIVKILDFGISKFASDSDLDQQTADGSIFGTLRYMPPEQVRSATNVDVRSDVYALGVILYEMLSGQHPFEEKSRFELLECIVNGTFQPLRELRPELDPGLILVTETAMHRDRERRYGSARLLAAALEPYSSGFVEPRPSRPEIEEGDTIASTPPGPPKRKLTSSAPDGIGTDENDRHVQTLAPPSSTLPEPDEVQAMAKHRVHESVGAADRTTGPISVTKGEATSSSKRWSIGLLIAAALGGLMLLLWLGAARDQSDEPVLSSGQRSAEPQLEAQQAGDPVASHGALQTRVPSASPGAAGSQPSNRESNSNEVLANPSSSTVPTTSPPRKGDPREAKPATAKPELPPGRRPKEGPPEPPKPPTSTKTAPEERKSELDSENPY